MVDGEKYGDWYRDPWGWPEASPQFVSTLQPRDLGVLKTAGRFGTTWPAFHAFSFPKSYVGVRPAVVLDAASRIAYTSAAVAIAPRLHNNLPDWVYGWRLRDGVFSASAAEWSLYQASQAPIATSPFAAQTDITSFFATVDVQLLIRSLTDSGIAGAPLGVIEDVLNSHCRLSTRSGLTQRSIASSMLANIALRDIDDLLLAAIDEGRLTGARRWMDDISFEGSEAALYRTLVQLQEFGRQFGLEINTSKTKVTTGSESAAALQLEAQRLILVTRDEAAFSDDYPDAFSTVIDASELEDAEDRLLAAPRDSSRTLAGLVLKSLRHFERFDRIDEWLGAARYLPHAADHLSRFISRAHYCARLPLDPSSWFVREQERNWPYLEWTSAQHALALPSDVLSPDARQVLMGWLASSQSLQQVAVAVQRLGSAPTSSVRTAIANRIDTTSDPLVLRVLALGLWQAGGSRDRVDAALRRHPSNTLILNYLNANRWHLPRVQEDFDPSQASGDAA
ncbi:RNA-directed DNA polymerase [Protaetiibacter larvae]|nr:RNA-directed DNA polymerase [Protaetiibacter larvae]